MHAGMHSNMARGPSPSLPGLTHEDPQQLREKTLRLIDDLQPSNQAELDQVCQAARLTLAIERAERLEMAHMNQRIRDAAHVRAQEVNPRLLEDIQELGRRLLYIAAAEEVKVPRQPLWSDDPRLLVAKLEASAEGCRWLLARWAEFRILLDRGCRWDTADLLRCIRLQGKNVAESVYDPALNVLFVAWDVLVPKFAAEEWENFREERFRKIPRSTTASAGVRSWPGPPPRRRRGRCSMGSSTATSRTSMSCWRPTRPGKRSRTTTGPTARRWI